jgi:predicted transcriptional regulator
MPKRECNGCEEEAFTELFNLVWLCKKHYLIVLDDLNFKQEAGRPRKIQMSRIFRWFENKTYISISDFMRDFNVTYPTASYYFKILQKFGFLEKTGSLRKVVTEKKKEVVTGEVA